MDFTLKEKNSEKGALNLEQFDHKLLHNSTTKFERCDLVRRKRMFLTPKFIALLTDITIFFLGHVNVQ